jgi:ketosteroid isomerase-like protein
VLLCMESSTLRRDTAWAMSEENVELVRQGYEAWNRGDLEWLLEHVTPDYEFWTEQLFPDTEARAKQPAGCGPKGRWFKSGRPD